MGHSELFYAFLITTIALALVSTLLYQIRIPPIVSFVLTGLIIGPFGANLVKSLPAANMIAELGIILLMFSLGLEISLGELKRLFKPLLVLGFNQVFITLFIGAGLFIALFDVELKSALVFGALLALSSTALVLKLLQEHRETETPHGRYGIVILLFQDMVALPFMIAVPLLAATGSSTTNVSNLITVISKLVIFLIGAFLAGKYLVPRLFTEVSKTKSREVFFFWLISLTMLFAYLAESAGLSMSLGAFVAGVIISESPFNREALAELSPLRDVFLGLFFASIGMLLDLKFVFENLNVLLVLIVCLFLLKFLIIYLLVRFTQKSHGVSFATASSLSQIGEFSFILAASAKLHGIMSEAEFQYFLALAVLSLIFTPPMFKLALIGSSHADWPDLKRSLTSKTERVFSLNKLSSAEADTKLNTEKNLEIISKIEAGLELGLVKPRQAIVIGLGHSGRIALESLRDHGIPSVGLDMNMATIEELRQTKYSVLFGDATRSEILEAAGIENSFLVVVTVTGRHLTPQIVSLVHKLAPDIQLVIRLHYLVEKAALKVKTTDIVLIAEEEISVKIRQEILNKYRLWQELDQFSRHGS